MLVFAETAKLKTAEINEGSEQGRALQSRHLYSVWQALTEAQENIPLEVRIIGE